MVASTTGAWDEPIVRREISTPSARAGSSHVSFTWPSPAWQRSTGSGVTTMGVATPGAEHAPNRTANTA